MPKTVLHIRSTINANKTTTDPFSGYRTMDLGLKPLADKMTPIGERATSIRVTLITFVCVQVQYKVRA